MQDERLGPPLEAKERLMNGEWLWNPDLLRDIRRSTEAKKVVVFDLDGVLRSTEGKILHPLAHEVVDWVVARGLYSVLWTSARAESFGTTPGLGEIIDKMNLVITRENYRLPGLDSYGRAWRDFEQYDKWREAVDRVEWVDEVTRKLIIDRGEKVKLPSVLFRRSVLIEDGNTQKPVYSYTDRSMSWDVFVDTHDAQFAQLMVGSFGIDMLNETRVLSVDRVREHFGKLGWVKGE